MNSLPPAQLEGGGPYHKSVALGMGQGGLVIWQGGGCYKADASGPVFQAGGQPTIGAWVNDAEVAAGGQLLQLGGGSPTIPAPTLDKFKFNRNVVGPSTAPDPTRSFARWCAEVLHCTPAEFVMRPETIKDFLAWVRAGRGIE